MGYSRNSDVFLGVTVWAAGGFTTGYELLATPELRNGVWYDTDLVKACVATKLGH
jgi:hypothetical protein